jgi:hypothetical protein
VRSRFSGLLESIELPRSAAFQTNEYFGSTGQGAACSEPVTNPTPCTAPTFLTMLQTGIYPLGQGHNLRAQYIEVFPANANAFPDDILQAHLALLAQAGFIIANRGGTSLTSKGATGSVSVGYGETQSNVGNSAPSGRDLRFSPEQCSRE